MFGGKWLRVVDDLVNYHDVWKVPEYYRVPGLRITGRVAPFSGCWIEQKKRFGLMTDYEMVLMESAKFEVAVIFFFLLLWKHKWNY